MRFRFTLAIGCALALGLVAALSFSRHPSRAVHENDEKFDSPDKAMEWRMLSWRDEHGNIPEWGMRTAMAQREANLQYWQKNTIQPNSLSWQFVGANNISGRILGLAIDPVTPTKIFAASAGGGLWRSNDGGSTWTLLGNRWVSEAVASVVFDPSDHNVMYAGTGEGTFNIDAIYGNGVYKSTDNGNTWNHMPSTNNIGDVNCIAVSPTDSKRILLASRGAPTTAQGGIMLSTDGGATFNNVFPGRIYEVRFSNQNPSNALASVFDNSGNTYVAYSTDGGATWTPSTGEGTPRADFGARVQIQYAPSDNSIVYAARAESGSVGDMLKSTDGGHSFTKLTTVNTGQMWYDNCLWVDPTNPLVACFGAQQIFMTTDGGNTWPAMLGYGVTVHPDFHYIIGDPGYNGTTNRRVYVANDGGVWYAQDILTANPSSGWVNIRGGLQTDQFYSAAGDAKAGVFLGGAQDNGTQIFKGSPTSSLGVGGDGTFVALDQTDPNFMYGSFPGLTMFRSTDGGNNFNYMTTGLGDAGSNANFVPPFIISPNNPNTMWAGGGSLWRCTNAKDASPTWSQIFNRGSYPISAIAECPGNADNVWIGYNDGVVYKSTNATSATPTFNQVNGLPGRYIGRILMEYSNPNRVYVALGGFTAGNLMTSADGGATWAPASGSGVTALPNVPVHGIAMNPTDHKTLYAGTEVGFFSSSDGGQYWSATYAGPSNVCVDEVRITNDGGSLVLATHGLGIFTAPIASTAPFPDIASVAVTPGEVTGTKNATVKVTLTQSYNGTLTIPINSNDKPIIGVPTSITIPANALSGTFAVTTTAVDSKTNVKVSATLRVTMTGGLTIDPAKVSGISLAATTATGGGAVKASALLNANAGPSGHVVNVASSNTAAASVPPAATVPAGSTIGSFSIATHPVNASQSVTITVSDAAATATKTLTVVPAALTSVSGVPSSIVGGNKLTVYATLNGGAGSQGIAVGLSSTSSLLGLPGTLTVPSGASTGSLKITTQGVDAATQATITATAGSVTKTGTVTLNPAALLKVTFNPLKVVGGNNSVATVTLNGAAGPSGIAFTLNGGTYLTAPSGGSVAAQAFSGPVTVGSVGVPGARTGVLQATLGTQTVSGNLALTAASLITLHSSVTTITGGSKFHLTVGLNGFAPPAGLKVLISSDNPAAFGPASVMVAPNTNSLLFTYSTAKVTSTQTANITATAGSVTQTVTVTVTP